MSEVSERYRTIADGFTARVQGFDPDRWSSPSPCTGWTARDVAVHVVNTHRRVVAVLEGTDPVEADQDEDLPGQWLTERDRLLAVLGDEARATKTVSGMFGEQPFESLVGRLMCADTLIHTWDLAKATGQDHRLDPSAVAKAIEFLTPIDDAIRRPGGFAAKITPPPGADDQTRLLNFCGRAV